jgi:hypothetical protein
VADVSDEPPRNTPAPPWRIASRRREVREGWARQRHIELDDRLEDVVAADVAQPRGALATHGLEGRRF